MSRLLFLAVRMKMGFGVSVAIHEVAERLSRRGHSVTIGCLDADASVDQSYKVVRLDGNLEASVLALADASQADAVVAHTSPFFELLPVIRHGYRTWAWEYGDPTPQLFAQDGRRRERIQRYKMEFCYPVVDGVIAISEFIRRDIEWPAAHVLPLGCDHAPDTGSKGLRDVNFSSERPLRVGALMRLGPGEANYKGAALSLSLVDALRRSGVAMEFCIMGRGEEADAEAFRTAGWHVTLNASDQEKWEYLRGLDVFVSSSLWEGFDLPLVEAQAVGTLGLAFDTGAHPETCPLLFSSASEMGRFLVELAQDRSLVLRHSIAAHRFVRSRFQWDRVVARFEELVAFPQHERVAFPQPEVGPSPRRHPVIEGLSAVARSLRYEGVSATIRKVPGRVRSRAQRT